ncbi:MAG: zinc ribbon domain-containing protein [Phormidesmis sp.]
MADAAAYKCELGSNQRLHLSNEGSVTAVTLLSSGPGQQQQSSNRFTTGQWTVAPTLYRLDQGMLVVISATSTYYLQLQEGQAQMLSGPLSSQMADRLKQAQPMAMQRDDRARTILDSPLQPMTPLQPMAPLRMNKNPLSMSMGNMKMSMGKAGLGEMSLGEMSLGEMSLGDRDLGSQPEPAASSSSASGGAHSQDEPETSTVRHFCSQCGSAVAPSDRFCSQCGTSLT